ncbi:MAG: hypothetical protein U0571_14165 [Candidatus Brocadia sapporoensis]
MQRTNHADEAIAVDEFDVLRGREVNRLFGENTGGYNDRACCAVRCHEPKHLSYDLHPDLVGLPVLALDEIGIAPTLDCQVDTAVCALIGVLENRETLPTVSFPD